MARRSKQEPVEEAVEPVVDEAVEDVPEKTEKDSDWEKGIGYTIGGEKIADPRLSED